MWEKINKFIYSRVILSAILIVVLFIILLGLFSGLTISNDMDTSLLLVIFTIGQLVLSILAIWLMRKLDVFNINDFKFKDMGKGFLLAWVGFVCIIIYSIVSIIELPANSFVTPNILYLLIIFVHLLFGTSIFEEVLLRGLILKVLLKKMSHSKRGIIIACIISSAVFGIAHIGNIITITDKSSIGSYLLVFSQLIYAAAAGFFFAALFLRTKTLWIPIVMHTLFNLPTYIIDAITSPGDVLFITETLNEINIPWLIINTLLVLILFIAAGLVLLKKVQPEEITDWIPERKAI